MSMMFYTTTIIYSPINVNVNVSISHANIVSVEGTVNVMQAGQDDNDTVTDDRDVNDDNTGRR